MTPREELEERLTALLLGELSAEEAASLRQSIAQDPKLARLHDQLGKTIELVRETVTSPEHELPTSADPPKLAGARREKLLESFKVVRLQQLERVKRRKTLRRDLAALAAMIVGLCLLVGLLFFSSSSSFKAPDSTASSGRRFFANLTDADFFDSSPLNWFRRARERGVVPLSSRPMVDEAIDAEKAPTTLALELAPAAGQRPQSATRLPIPGLPSSPPGKPSLEKSRRQTVYNSDGSLMPSPAQTPTDPSAGALRKQAHTWAATVAGDDLPLSKPAATSDSTAEPLARRSGRINDQGSGISERGSVTRGARIELPQLAESSFGRQSDLDSDQSVMVDSFTTLRQPSANEPGQRVAGDRLAQAGESPSFGNSQPQGTGPSIGGAGVAGGAVATPGNASGVLGGLRFESKPGLGGLAGDGRLGAAGGGGASPGQILPAPAVEGGATANLPAATTAPVEDGVTRWEESRVNRFEIRPAPEKGLSMKSPAAAGVPRPVMTPPPATPAEPASIGEVRVTGLTDLNGQSRHIGVGPDRLIATFSYGMVTNSADVALNFDAAGGFISGGRKNQLEAQLGERFGDISQESGLNQQQNLSGLKNPLGAPANGRGFDQVTTDAGDSASRFYRSRLMMDDFAKVADKGGLEGGDKPVKPSEAKESGVYSQNPVGYLNIDASKFNNAFKDAKQGIAVAETDEKKEAGKQFAGINKQLDEQLDGVTAGPKFKIEAAGRTTARPAAPTAPSDRAIPSRQLAELQKGRDQVRAEITQPKVDANVAVPGNQSIESLKEQVEDLETKMALSNEEMKRRKNALNPEQPDVKLPKPAAEAGIPQPEVNSADNPFSTFSLNVSDVSFKLAAASLEKGVMPEPASVRSEEFINAFDYRDPEPAGSAPIAFAWERARYPFAHDRDLVRFSVKTAALGRQPGRPLNLVLLLDNSGSMERADRVRIRQECLSVLAGQLQPQDRVSVVAFARTARLWVDGLAGSQAGELAQRLGGLTPDGGTNLEDAMNLAYQTALRHFLANGVNRVVLLTDGAANLGDVNPDSLKKKIEAHRQQGVALDCFGIGWEGYNDDLLEVLSRNGDGRYGFVNTPEAASTEFAAQLAGALKVAASDVKVQVEFNPRRATAYRQIGYAKHQLKKEQFRDNTVDAAEIGAAEAGNALYVVQVNPRGEGPLGTVRVRFKIPGTSDYREHEWPVPYNGTAKLLEQSSPALRLAASAAAFSEWLVASPYAAEVTPDRLLAYLSGVPESCSADPRPTKLEWMVRQAKSLSGK